MRVSYKSAAGNIKAFRTADRSFTSSNGPSPTDALCDMRDVLQDASTSSLGNSLVLVLSLQSLRIRGPTLLRGLGEEVINTTVEIISISGTVHMKHRESRSMFHA
jgi:hypothetical protein